MRRLKRRITFVDVLLRTIILVLFYLVVFLFSFLLLTAGRIEVNLALGTSAFIALFLSMFVIIFLLGSLGL